MSHLGEAAALATALSWTVSSLCFGLASRRAGGFGVNLFRLLLALPVLVLLHALVCGAFWPAGLPSDRLLLLALSGLVGLVLGDIGYFYALAAIGPRISSVLMATWPSMALLLSWWTQGEVPGAYAAAGVALTTAGVALVLLRGSGGSAWNRELTAGRRALAIAGALCGALGQAGAVALARPAMAPGPDLPDGVPPLSATLVRMVAACAGILLVAALQRRGGLARVVRNRRALGEASLGTAFGPVVGVWLSMVAVRHAQLAGAAAALMATTPIWMMPVSFFAYRARIGWLGAIGTLVTVLGAALLLIDVPDAPEGARPAGGTRGG